MKKYVNIFLDANFIGLLIADAGSSVVLSVGQTLNF
jgi:hypothetical protein